MKFAYYYDENGCIVYVEGLQGDEAPDRPVGVGHIIIDELVEPTKSRVADGVLVPLPEKPEHATHFDYAAVEWVIDIEAIKSERLVDIDNSAGAARSRHITTSPGQELAYADKYRNALKFLDGQRENNHWVDALSRARGVSVEEAAQLIIDRHHAWEVVGAQIEEVREAGKLAVMQAETAGEVDGAATSAIAALNII